MTVRMPSWRSIAAKASLTSSSAMRRVTSDSEVEVAGEVAVHELGHAVAALGAAERGARDPAAGDQVARDDLEHLALAGHAGDRAEAPAHARGLDRLAHDRRRCRWPRRCSRRRSRRSSRGSASTASGPPMSVSVAPWPRACSSRSSARSTQMIRSAPASRAPATAPRPTRPAPKTAQVEPALDLGDVERGADAGGRAAGERADHVERRLGVHLGQRDLRHHGRLGERARAHEVADRARSPRCRRVVPSGR